MPSTSVVPTDLAYAAGVIDSDGYIGVHRSDYAMRVRGDASQVVYSARVQLKQVTPQAVEFMHVTFGGHRYEAKATAARGRPLLAWAVHSAAAGRVCRLVLPYLRIKREQALNVMEVCEINSGPSRRGWDLPEVDPDEPLLPLLEAARLAGRSPDVAYQSAHIGNIPVIRKGRRVFVPESYVETWRHRPGAAPRRAALSERLDHCFIRAKELNRVGV